jgi:hypothetical protein
MTLALALVGVTRAGPAGASPGACSTKDGVTVAIDFGDLATADPPITRTAVVCAPGSPDSGFGALTAAGVGFTSAARSPGFLCRIAGRPSNDPCINPSPATAYWSYWLAVRGGTWCLSPVGAGNRKPPPGTVDGWAFEHDLTGGPAHPPAVAPPPPLPGVPVATLAPGDCVSTSTAPTTVTTVNGSTSGAPGGAGGATAPLPSGPTRPSAAGGGTAAVVPTGAGSTTTAVAAAGGADGSTTTTAGAAATTRTEDSVVAVGPDLSGNRGSGSGPIGVVVAVALLGAVGTAALLLRRRRLASRGSGMAGPGSS